MGFWLLLLLTILLLLAVPWWPYSRPWGYGPGGVLLALLIVWIVLLWLRMVVFYWPWAPPLIPAPPPA